MYDVYHDKIRDSDEKIEAALSQIEPAADSVVTSPSPAPQASKKPRKHELGLDARTALIKMTGVDLTEIPCIEAATALRVVSMIGHQMESWKTEKHFASWLGLAPGTPVSGGKQLSGRSQPTSNRAAAALRGSAQTLYKSKTALGAYYRRLRARMGAPKAITAAARKLAILIYRMLKQKTPYREIGQDYYEKQYEARIIRNLERKAAFFGFELKKREQDGPQAQIA